MNKLTLLLLLPLTACNTPGQLAQLRADESARTAKEAQAESACIERGLSTHTTAFMECVNTRLHGDGLEIVRDETGKIALLNLRSDSFPYELGGDGHDGSDAAVPAAPSIGR
jgi:hypothetical protein